MHSSKFNANTLLAVTVGACAIFAPALHSVSDILEWYQNGYTVTQLWLKYIAFIPMPWLLLGICLAHTPRLGTLGFVGALLYGMGFVYFEHTVLYALAEDISTYQELKSRLGALNTVYGTFMIYGALMFAWAAFRARWLPGFSVLLLALGIVINFLLWLANVPDSFQTIGSAVKNLGIASMGWTLLFKRGSAAVSQETVPK